MAFNAYYYSLAETGVPEVDAILEAVADAGKAYHLTEEWNEPYRDGTTPASRIQDAANKAAQAFKAGPITSAQERLLADRIEWLKQKLDAQRAVGGPEYTSSQLLIGRTQGNIGALEWALRELKKVEESK